MSNRCTRRWEERAVAATRRVWKAETETGRGSGQNQGRRCGEQEEEGPWPETERATGSRGPFPGPLTPRPPPASSRRHDRLPGEPVLSGLFVETRLGALPPRGCFPRAPPGPSSHACLLDGRDHPRHRVPRLMSGAWEAFGLHLSNQWKNVHSHAESQHRPLDDHLKPTDSSFGKNPIMFSNPQVTRNKDSKGRGDGPRRTAPGSTGRSVQGSRGAVRVPAGVLQRDRQHGHRLSTGLKWLFVWERRVSAETELQS